MGPWRSEELVGILGRSRDGGDPGAHLVPGRQLDRLERGGPPRAVGVEDQEQLVGEALEETYLVVGQRGAGAGDGVGHAGVWRGDDVELALHADRVPLLSDLVAG